MGETQREARGRGRIFLFLLSWLNGQFEIHSNINRQKTKNKLHTQTNLGSGIKSCSGRGMWRGRTQCKLPSSWLADTSRSSLGMNRSRSHFQFTAELYAILCYWLQQGYTGLKDSDLGTNVVLITPAFGSSGPATAQEEWFPQASLLHKSLRRCLGLDNPCRSTCWLFTSPIFPLWYFFSL